LKRPFAGPPRDLTIEKGVAGYDTLTSDISWYMASDPDNDERDLDRTDWDSEYVEQARAPPVTLAATAAQTICPSRYAITQSMARINTTRPEPQGCQRSI